MQIKTTMRHHYTCTRMTNFLKLTHYHLTPTTMTTIQKKKKKFKQSQQTVTTMWRNWNLCTLLAGMQNGMATVDNSMGVPQTPIKWNYHMIQQSHFWVCIRKN